MNKRSELYVGIMSGTSLDGIDAVLLDLSSNTPRLVASYYQAYPDSLKDTLLSLHQPTPNELHHTLLVGNELARSYAAATQSLLAAANTSPAEVRAIGCHGQTVRHRPEIGYTVQLGNAALLTELCSITVVNDFRSRDIAAGGQGAPLVPAFHHKMLRHPEIHRVVVNIGGISNLTNLAPNQSTFGFDCGPGNLLMDAWIKRHLDLPFDQKGRWAASGTVLHDLLQRLINEPYFHLTPPKSCGRDLFNMQWLDKFLNGNENPADVQSTLLELTAYTICSAILKYCRGAQEVYLCGGGARNLQLLQRMQAYLPDCQIQLTNQLGIDADWLEAIAFAWLAQQTIHGLSANLPEATGAHHPCILGAIHQA